MSELMFKGGVTKYWWVPLLTGLLAIGIGIWCLCSPTSSLPILAYAMAACFCFAGGFNTAFSVLNVKNHPGWGWSLALGILELIMGIWLLSMPVGLLTETFIYAVGIYIIFVVINSIAEVTSVYRGASSWVGWLIGLLLITLVFAVVFISGPLFGGMVVWLWIGISFILFGCYRVSISMVIRKINHKIRF